MAWAIRTTINPELKYSPCHLAFSQDMLFCHVVSIDWTRVHQIRNTQARASNNKENKARVANTYSIGNKVPVILDADKRREQPK
jgi:hypothetical protein